MSARRVSTVLLGIGLPAALLLAALPAAADWLVLRDGVRVETKGPWQVKGKQVVFTQTDGKLAALRLVDVDLDASASATAPPPKAEPEKAAPVVAEKKKSVLVLTDKDVRHVDDNGAPLATTDAPKAADAAPKASEPPAGGVLVESWDRAPLPDGNGVEISGSLKNTGANTATEIAVVAKVFDESGALLGTADAILASQTLAPARSTSFRADFPGILTFASARFEVKNRSLLPAPASTSTR